MHISTSAGYFIAIIIGLMINLFARLKPSKVVTLGDLMDVGLSNRINRFAFLFIWWWLGWHFLGSLQPI